MAKIINLDMFRFFIGLAIMAYEPIYHNLQIWKKTTHPLKINRELKNFPSRNNGSRQKTLHTGPE